MLDLTGIERLTHCSKAVGLLRSHSQRDAEHRVRVRVQRDHLLTRSGKRPRDRAGDGGLPGAALAGDRDLHRSLTLSKASADSLAASCWIAWTAGDSGAASSTATPWRSAARTASSV